MSSGPVWTHILCGENAITKWRNLLGPTKVLKTVYDQPDSIRGRFGLTDTRNCAHGSDSQVTAMREIKFFYPNFNPDLWYKTEHKLFMHDMVYFDHDLFEHHSSYSKNYIENVAPS